MHAGAFLVKLLRHYNNLARKYQAGNILQLAVLGTSMERWSPEACDVLNVDSGIIAEIIDSPEVGNLSLRPVESQPLQLLFACTNQNLAENLPYWPQAYWPAPSIRTWHSLCYPKISAATTTSKSQSLCCTFLNKQVSSLPW